MHCTKCGAENPDDAQLCGSCSAVLTDAAPAGPTTETKTSAMAITALILGVLSPVTCFLSAIPAIVLGIISLVRIERSGGRLMGKGYALTGIIVPILMVPLFIVVFILPRGGSELPPRTMCGSNLKGIGTAMIVYANEDENGRFPISGLPQGQWGAEHAWDDPIPAAAFANNQATIASSLYLLVKHDYTTTSQFVCKSDAPTLSFSTTGINYREVWDFGDPGNVGMYVSYAYHMVYDDGSGISFPLTAASDPGLAVAADRSPGRNGGANSNAHQGHGQNVMFVDTHVAFLKTADQGLNGDDIYSSQLGANATAPANRSDSFLVNDPK